MHLEISKTLSGIIYTIQIISNTEEDTKALSNTEPTIELLVEDNGNDIWLEISL